MASATIYDSDADRRTLASSVKAIWRFRGLLRLLVARNLVVRYKRSVLGVWWTLLNPFLTTAIMWVVFGQLFRFETPGTPYIVYLLSGVIMVNFFSQGVYHCAHTIVENARILTKVYVPPEIFSVAAAIVALINFGMALIALLVVQIIVGTGVPASAPLAVVAAISMALMVVGLGLLVAAIAVHFYDVFDMLTVVLQLLAYLTPSFYPVTIVPERLRFIIEANPVYACLRVFRATIYEGGWPPGPATAYALGAGIVSAVVGGTVFARSWKQVVIRL